MQYVGRIAFIICIMLFLYWGYTITRAVGNLHVNLQRMNQQLMDMAKDVDNGRTD